MIEGFVFQFPRIAQVLVTPFFILSVGHTFPFSGKNRPGNIQLLGGRGDGLTGSIITCYMERSIMDYYE